MFSPHVKVAFGGAIVTTTDQPEIWECTVNVIGAGDVYVGPGAPGGFPIGPVTIPDGPFNVETYLTEINGPLATWFAATDSGMSGHASLQYVKANAIDANGHYVDTTGSNTFDYATAAAGGVNPNCPSIISTVFSWTTFRHRGPGSHGRIYPPNPVYGNSQALTITSSDQTAAAASAVALLHVLENGTGTALAVPCVSSKVDATNTPISGVRIGSIKDVQRRRKDAMKPAYVAGDFVLVI